MVFNLVKNFTVWVFYKELFIKDTLRLIYWLGKCCCCFSNLMVLHKTYLTSPWPTPKDSKDALKRVYINFVWLRTPWGEIQDNCRDGLETKTNWLKTIKLNSFKSEPTFPSLSAKAFLSPFLLKFFTKCLPVHLKIRAAFAALCAQGIFPEQDKANIETIKRSLFALSSFLYRTPLSVSFTSCTYMCAW